MRVILVFMILVLSGCAVKPQVYDLSTSGIYKPIVSKQNLPNILITDFKYEPSINISQNTISHFGCIPCQSDGSTPGIVFSDPINKIILAEVKSAFKEVIVPTAKSSCSLSATIHLAAWNGMNGDSTVDLTYMLSNSDQIKYIKRIRGTYDNSFFEINKINRFLAKATRKTVEELITNDEFLNEISTVCSENITRK